MSVTDTSGPHLRAVLHADMVDYSKVTARSNVLSVRCVAAIREAFAEVAPRHGGWFRAKAGDAVLALFPSAVGAVTSAIEIQRRLARVRAESPELPVWLRIGVHLGEVTPDGDDWHGDSINTAARIQSATDPGGLKISGEVYRAVRNQMDVTLEDLGLHDLKGVGALHLFKVVIGTERSPSWAERLLVRRRELGVAAALAAVAVVFGRRIVDHAIELRRGQGPGVAPPPTVAGETHWPLSIGVMEIRPVGETPDWMCDITHEGLNALLSKFDKLRVFSKDVIDWKRERTGKRPFEIAHELGITRMINGVLIRTGVRLTLEVRIVDTETGQQLDSCEAAGTEDKLVEIQNNVGLELVRGLKVPVTKAEVDKALAARTNVDLDVTKRFADAFGGQEEEAAKPKSPPGAWRLTWPAEADAVEADEAGVKQLLESYRSALEAKNLEQLAAIYMNLSDATRDALSRYFQSAGDLRVRFSVITVLFEGDEAFATFTRSDNFKDVQTGRDVNLEVRVSTVVTKAAGAWKIKALRKPS